MEIIGRTTINPVVFYSGKISGYITWVLLVLYYLRVDLITRYSIFHNEYIAVITTMLGLVTIIMSFLNLGRSVRLGLPSGETRLKTGGIYRISRNPMYLGFNMITLSSMIYSLNLLILAGGIYSILVYHLIILGEERFMVSRFGEDYKKYTQKVRRYI